MSVKCTAHPASHATTFALISAVYIICIVIFFFPSLNGFSTALLGPPEDNGQDLWNTWYSQKTFETHPSSFFHTNLLYYPEGGSLRYHSFCYTGQFLIFAFRKLLFLSTDLPVLAFMNNFIMLFSFYLAAVACFYLIRHYTNNTMASLVGGFIFAFSPFHFAHALHHMPVAAVQFIPIFVLCVINYVETRKWFFLAGAVASFALNALSCWYYLFYCGYFMLFHYLYHAAKNRAVLTRELLAPMIKICGLTFLVLAPITVPMMLEGFGNPGSYRPDVLGHANSVADLLGFITLQPYHVLSGLTDGIMSHLTGNLWEKTVYLGMANLALICWWLYTKQKTNPVHDAAYLICGMLFFMLIAGGDYLHIYGITTPLPLPTLLADKVPVLSNVRTPSRAIVFAYLFLAVLVALIMAKYAPTLSKQGRMTFYGVMAILIFIDYYPTKIEVTPVALPPAYQMIKQDRDRDFGVLDLPGGDWEGGRFMFYQTMHGKPIVNATTARKLESTLSDNLDFDDVEAQKEQLIRNKVKYIVIHASMVNDKTPMYAYLEHFQPAYADDDAIVIKMY